MGFEENSAFDWAHRDMDRFLEDWQKRSKVGEDVEKSTEIGSDKENSEETRTSRDQSIFYLNEMRFALDRAMEHLNEPEVYRKQANVDPETEAERLEDSLAEFVYSFIQINRELESMEFYLDSVTDELGRG
jgi:hypothetical protein